MRLFIYCAVLVWLIHTCSPLTCRSGHGPKDDELRKVFNNCLQQQQGNNNENSRQSQENNWKNRDKNQKNHGDKDNRRENEDDGADNRHSEMQDRQRNKENRENTNERKDSNQSNMNGSRRTDGRYDRNNGKEDVGDSINRMNSGDRMDYNNGNNRGRNQMMTRGRNDHLTGQDEFLQSEEFGDDSQVNYYTSQAPRRYKREKRVEMNSGQRSQYNPHSQKAGGYENEGRNSSDNSSKEIDKACILHCFLENLHMTGDSGMPDRYLVTHALTKDEKNEDLRDFLQESIEECFQILDNENTEDKCEFSKNLLTCLSEKGRANCDDWNGKSIFMF